MKNYGDNANAKYLSKNNNKNPWINWTFNQWTVVAFFCLYLSVKTSAALISVDINMLFAFLHWKLELNCAVCPFSSSQKLIFKVLVLLPPSEMAQWMCVRVFVFLKRERYNEVLAVVVATAVGASAEMAEAMASMVVCNGCC